MNLTLWIAQGFGSGRVPFAPGTFGSLVGLLWFLLLLRTHNLAAFIIGTMLGIAASVYFCGQAEKILRQKDPGSVVLDEIAAMPICFFSWVFIPATRPASGPWEWDTYLGGQRWLLFLLVFVLFRVFDILKPWPARQSQNLRGGWGVTVDDLFAAVWVNAVFLAGFYLHRR